MSTHIVNRRYPRFLAWERWCRNGQIVDGKFASYLGDALAHAIQYRKGIVAEKVYAADNIPAGVQGGPTTLFEVATHIGHNVEVVRAIVVLAQADTRDDPYITIAATDGLTGGSTTESSQAHAGGVDVASADAPDSMSWGHVLDVAVTPDTDYRIAVRTYSYARLHSILIFQAPPQATVMDDADTGCIDPRAGVGQRILDSREADWLVAATQMWRDSGQQVANFIADNTARAPTVTATDYTNILDGSSTTVTAATPPAGMIQLSYHNSRDQAEVPVRIAVKGEITAGANTGSVRLVNAGGDYVEVTGIGAAGWYSAAGTLAAGRSKYDWQAKVGASTTLRIDTVCAWEEDP